MNRGEKGDNALLGCKGRGNDLAGGTAHALRRPQVCGILDRVVPDAVVLPHGSDSNADHRRTFRIFDRCASGRELASLALLVRDPKTLGMRLDLIRPFVEREAEWKGELLRCHASQQERNVRSRGSGLDERILRVNREIAAEAGCVEPFAEGFEVKVYRAKPCA